MISHIDVTNDNCGSAVVLAMKGRKIDILVNNAGYFYEPVEKINTLNFAEEMKMIDICALGVLRITSALYNSGLLAQGSKVICTQFLYYCLVLVYYCLVLVYRQPKQHYLLNDALR